MKTEDLMIGNWVYNKFTNKPVRLSEQDFLRRGGMFFLEPIPLTEENIVSLLGFVNVFFSVYCWDRGISVCFIFNIVKFNDIKFPLPKHVHKLQQLIKSLEE